MDGVVTWTPGDVTAAEKKGGLVSIVSTKEYRSQMPHVIIGNKKWINANRDIVEGHAARRSSRAATGQARRRRASPRRRALSASVYNEKDGAYWYKYFHAAVVERTSQGR